VGWAEVLLQMNVPMIRRLNARGESVDNESRTPRLPFGPDSHGRAAFAVLPGLPWNSVGVFGCAAGWWSAVVGVVLGYLPSRSVSLCRTLLEPARGIHVFTRIASACSRTGSRRIRRRSG